MKIIKILSLFTISTCLFSACEQESIETVESKTAVVEAYLYAGQSVDSISITQSFSYAQSDSNILTLDQLDITFSDFSNPSLLTSIGDGIYQKQDIVIEHGKSYRLEFVWEGEVISAETYIPLKKEAQLSASQIELDKVELGSFGGGAGNIPDPVEITWDNSEGDYYYVVVKNIEDEPEYVNENVAQFQAENGGQSRFIFITEPQIIDFHALDARRDLTQFGTHQIIIFRVNPEYAALYESSGSSTLSLEQPPTNVINGLGIFTGVSSDTLYLEVKKI